MFDGLTGRLSDIFGRLRRRGTLSEEDVQAALREIRVALLEADVALPVVKTFIAQVQERAVGQQVLRSVTPGQQVVKIVHDTLVDMLGGNESEGGDISLSQSPPTIILMVGLQGSGKTTTSGKLALRLRARLKHRVLMASLDTRRPAAQEQLRILGEQAEVATLPIIAGEEPVTITERAIEAAKLEGYDVLILDTAGRLTIDRELMAEVTEIRRIVRPHETLLVADAMTGQDAVQVAETFEREVGLTGIILTRVDGDARGGAALSMRQATGRPIKLIGVGEKLDALEPFHADRIASRILDMGDVVSLVEKAAETIDQQEAERLALRLRDGGFDLEDMLNQLRQVRKLGGMSGMLSMLPGIGKIRQQIKDAKIDESMIGCQEAIILSMTTKERRDVRILNASRRRRIALGSGTTVQDVNRLLKQHQDMQTMMKQMRKLGKKGLLRHGLKGVQQRGSGF